MARQMRFVVGLDIGTSKIRCLVARPSVDGTVQVLGLGEAESRGLRKGVVVNVDAAVEAVKKAVTEAEMTAGLEVDFATLGISGGHIRSFNSRGVVAVGNKDRVVSGEDRHRVLESARAVSIPPDREILHVLPMEFVLDDQGGIASPEGLVGSRLEANVHLVTAATTPIQNLVTCANRAGVEIVDTLLEQLAAAEVVLGDGERELGVALIDIGGGTSELAVFESGALAYTSVLPVGGNHFTNDLAVGLRAPIPDSERLKIRHGFALASLVQEDEAIEVPTVGGGRPRLLSRQVMAEILQPRAEELFTLFREEIVRAGFEKSLNAGVVLTGGGVLLAGMAGVAEHVFNLPVRHGEPQGVTGLVEPPVGPELATVIGLAVYSARNETRQRVVRPVVPNGMLGRVGERMRTWISEMF